MSAPAAEPRFDAELAWDIQEWPGIGPEGNLTREDIKSLAAYLTGLGYTKGKSGGLSSLLSSIEEVGAKLADEAGPLFDTLSRYRKP